MVVTAFYITLQVYSDGQINRNKCLVFCFLFLTINKIKNTSTLNEDGNVTTTALENSSKAENVINQFSGSPDLYHKGQQTTASKSNPAFLFLYGYELRIVL